MVKGDGKAAICLNSPAPHPYCKPHADKSSWWIQYKDHNIMGGQDSVCLELELE